MPIENDIAETVDHDIELFEEFDYGPYIKVMAEALRLKKELDLTTSEALTLMIAVRMDMLGQGFAMFGQGGLGKILGMFGKNGD